MDFFSLQIRIFIRILISYQFSSFDFFQFFFIVFSFINRIFIPFSSFDYRFFSNPFIFCCHLLFVFFRISYPFDFFLFIFNVFSFINRIFIPFLHLITIIIRVFIFVLHNISFIGLFLSPIYLFLPIDFFSSFVFIPFYICNPCFYFNLVSRIFPFVDYFSVHFLNFFPYLILLLNLFPFSFPFILL